MQEEATTIQPTTAGAASGPPVDEAREALGRHAWREAYEILSAADARGELSPAELELLAEAAWWTGQLPAAIEIRERAYAAATKAGDLPAAVMAAVGLARENLLRLDVSVARAWLDRAERLLEGAPESPGNGYLAACRSFADALTGDIDGALREASLAVEIADRTGDRDLAAFATSEKGFALVAAGRNEEGLALLAEATVAAVGGELRPATAGAVYCASIEGCASTGEWSRAAAWIEAQDRWCRREGINGYPGMCRLFRSEIKQLRGSWLEAEAEARQASVELQGFLPAAAASAFSRIGELRLLRGDLAGAEEALVRAHAMGSDPEPTLSLLRLAQGRADAAAAGIREALDEPARMPNFRAPPGTPIYRLPLLRARVEIAIATSDLPTARAAAEELASIAESFGTAWAKAASGTALGAVELAEGHADRAAQSLRRAVQAWSDLAAPYEAARARSALAEAYLAEGQPERALLEFHTARLVFEQLGAAPDLSRVDRQLAELRGSTTERAVDRTDERVSRTFVFTDIVDSTRLAEVLGDQGWTRLVRWHDQQIRTVVAEHGGEEIKATGDGFFLAFADPGAAIDAAIAVQRRLAQQREQNGFAPAVRIGLHRAEATRTGLDYLGLGVNYAARIGAAAETGEILATDETIAASRRDVSRAGSRTLSLKGISQPVAVTSIYWG